MRSILLSLGPWEWPAVFIIAAVLVVLALLWRRLERAIVNEPISPLSATGKIVSALIIALAAVAILYLVNWLAPLKIRSYGVMLLTGFSAGGYYAYRAGKKRGLDLQMVLDMIMLQLIFAIVGSRVLFVILAYGDYAQHPETMLDIWRGGLSFHGGVIGAAIATAVFCKWRNVRFAVLADICTPGVTIGYAITRIGCFLNGCCHGGPTDLPWGVVFPEIELTCPVHPTQLYAAAGSMILFGILVWAWPRMHRPGQMFPLYLILYSILRFLCEYSRRGYTGELSGIAPALTVAQFACIFIALAGLIILLILQRLPYENPYTAIAAQPQEAPHKPEPKEVPGGSRKRRRK